MEVNLKREAIQYCTPVYSDTLSREETLETVVSTNGTINAGEGWTNKFIFSPYEFTVADAMVSNFHLPYSTQLMMVAAFGGYDCVMNAYKIAREEGYRFGTYGDAMLLL